MTGEGPARLGSGRRSRALAVVLLALLSIFAAGAFWHFRGPGAEQRSNALAEKDRSENSPRGDSPRKEQEEEPPGRIVRATWYDVPVDSLAKRRAGDYPFTAAHNSLPLGTNVRVTHLANGRSVTVRITDRGITARGVKLDLCREAAEELRMVGQGVAKVRMNVLPDHVDAGPSDGRTATAQQ